MRKLRPTRLAGLSAALAAFTVLAVGGCNSGSHSGDAQGVSGATKAETRSQSATSKETPRSQSRTLAEALVAKVKALEAK